MAKSGCLTIAVETCNKKRQVIFALRPACDFFDRRLIFAFRPQRVKLLWLAIQGILYKQIDGVTMGSPLGPTIANFFLANLENRILKNKNQRSLKLYLRNVDDVFAVFENNNDCLSFLNSQHKNIKFTLEHSSDFICFLDVKLEINCNSLDTYTWRKPTNMDFYLILTPFAHKNGNLV